MASRMLRVAWSALALWWPASQEPKMTGDGYHSEGGNGFMSQENMTNTLDKALPHGTLYSAPCRWHDMCGRKLLPV